MPESAEAIHSSLRDYALTLPESWSDSPWGEDSVVKVRKKIFLFLGYAEGDGPQISVKLPDSAEHALSLPGATPTRYGLGRSGWVTVSIHPDHPGRELLIDWVEESYRTVAPKTLVAKLLAAGDQTD